MGTFGLPNHRNWENVEHSLEFAPSPLERVLSTAVPYASLLMGRIRQHSEYEFKRCESGLLDMMRIEDAGHVEFDADRPSMQSDVELLVEGGALENMQCGRDPKVAQVTVYFGLGAMRLDAQSVELRGKIGDGRLPKMRVQMSDILPVLKAPNQHHEAVGLASQRLHTVCLAADALTCILDIRREMAETNLPSPVADLIPDYLDAVARAAQPLSAIDRVRA